MTSSKQKCNAVWFHTSVSRNLVWVSSTCQKFSIKLFFILAKKLKASFWFISFMFQGPYLVFFREQKTFQRFLSRTNFFHPLKKKLSRFFNNVCLNSKTFILSIILLQAKKNFRKLFLGANCCCCCLWVKLFLKNKQHVSIINFPSAVFFLFLFSHLKFISGELLCFTSFTLTLSALSHYCYQIYYSLCTITYLSLSFFFFIHWIFPSCIGACNELLKSFGEMRRCQSSNRSIWRRMKKRQKRKTCQAAPKILLLIIVLVVEKSRFVIILRDGKMEN